MRSSALYECPARALLSLGARSAAAARHRGDRRNRGRRFADARGMPAALAGWFQVVCPMCDAALQVRLPEGTSSVRCSRALNCAADFRVFVPAVALKDAVPVGDDQVRRARPLDEDKEPSALVLYRAFMKTELARLRHDERGLARPEAMKRAAAAWRRAPANPMNGAT